MFSSPFFSLTEPEQPASAAALSGGGRGGPHPAGPGEQRGAPQLLGRCVVVASKYLLFLPPIP